MSALRGFLADYGALLVIVWELHRIADVLFTGGHPLSALAALGLIALLLYPNRKRTVVRRTEDA